MLCITRHVCLITEGRERRRERGLRTFERELQDGRVALRGRFVERGPTSAVRLQKPLLASDAQILQELPVTWREGGTEES